ncbi:MAG TPA: Holliday junction resolvase RuvX [Gammaproteobacteria bacterium]|nr:Holliday junction resolvase RuvX [Gammaproteobacteria bacterium]
MLAFDFGLRRLGVATANLATRTASPLTTLRVRDEIPWPDIDRVIDEWRPAHLVVGLPEGEGAERIARDVRAFVAKLGERYRLPVSTVDETLTSAAAQSELASARRSGYLRRRVDRGENDRIAACLIAEQWLNEQR